jgi:uncharacterized membrane protein
MGPMNLPPMRTLARAALIGAATGSRSLTGLAALTLTAPAAAAAQPDRTLRRSWVKALVAAGALGELGADKLAATPDRLAPRGLAGRVLIAALTGQIVARRDWPPRPGDSGPPDHDPAGEAAAVTVAVGVGSALAAAWLGSRWRRVAARHFGRDWPGAVLEDAAALSLARAAARP